MKYAYANKRVKIESKEHLNHVIKLTGMVINNKSTLERTFEKAGHKLYLFFGKSFDDEKEHWFYGHSVSFEGTHEFEEIFIPLPDSTLKDEHWNGVTSLRVGHIVHGGEVVAVGDGQVCIINEYGALRVHLLRDVKPAKSKAEQVAEEYWDLNDGAVDLTAYTQWLIDNDKLQS